MRSAYVAAALAGLAGVALLALLIWVLVGGLVI